MTTTNYQLIVSEDLSLNGRLFVDYDASFGANIGLNSDGAQIKMGVDNDVVIKHRGSTGLDIDAEGAVTIDAGGAVDIGADAAVTIDSAAAVSIDAGGSANLTAGGVLDLQGAGGVNVGVPAATTVKGTFNVDQAATFDTTVGISGAVTMDTNKKIQFRDTALFINSSADGQLDIDADTTLQLTAPTVDIDASTEVNISNALTVGGRIVTDDTTEATSTTDGSLQTDGGLSVAKDVIAGNDVKLLSDSAVLSLGADSDFSITHDGTTGATIAGNPVNITSGGAATFESTVGTLTLGGNSGVDIKYGSNSQANFGNSSLTLKTTFTL